MIPPTGAFLYLKKGISSFEVLNSIFSGMAEMQSASRPGTDLHSSGISAGGLASCVKASQTFNQLHDILCAYLRMR